MNVLVGHNTLLPRSELTAAAQTDARYKVRLKEKKRTVQRRQNCHTEVVRSLRWRGEGLTLRVQQGRVCCSIRVYPFSRLLLCVPATLLYVCCSFPLTRVRVSIAFFPYDSPSFSPLGHPSSVLLVPLPARCTGQRWLPPSPSTLPLHHYLALCRLLRFLRFFFSRVPAALLQCHASKGSLVEVGPHHCVLNPLHVLSKVLVDAAQFTTSVSPPLMRIPRLYDVSSTTESAALFKRRAARPRGLLSRDVRTGAGAPAGGRGARLHPRCAARVAAWPFRPCRCSATTSARTP